MALTKKQKSEIKKKAWRTRYKNYGKQGHSGEGYGWAEQKAKEKRAKARKAARKAAAR